MNVPSSLTLAVLVVVFISCHKSETESPRAHVDPPETVTDTPTATAAMGGIRTWHDTSFTYSNYGVPPITPNPDQTFAITIISPIRIQFKGRTLYYSPSRSSDSVLCFYDGYMDDYGNDHDMTASYFHYFDSIVTRRYDRVSAGGSTSEKWVTP